MTTSVRDLIRSLPLKEMDGSLLSSEIRERSRSLAIETWHNEPGYGFRHDTVDQAVSFAAYFHREQRRRNRGDLPKDPYINHPLRNALRLLRYGVKDTSTIVAAVLHDTLEDCASEMAKAEGTRDRGNPERLSDFVFAYRYLQGQFGADVAHLVEAVSNPDYSTSLTKAEKRSEYLAHVSVAIKDPRVWLIKFADWVDNAAGLYHNVGGAEMVAHLTAKYLPLADAFEAEFSDAVKALLPRAGVSAIEQHLRDGRASLQKLAEGVSA